MKQRLRRESADIRARISPAARQSFGVVARHHFVQPLFFQQSKHIASYLPFKDEFDSLPIIEGIWQANKVCYLPVISSQEKVLLFVRYQYGEKLHRNRYSILEPVDCSNTILPEQLDIVVMPLMAFDLIGHRLGTGGGYYDRTFAYLTEEHPSYKKPIFVGLAYSAQQVMMVPVDPWDLTVDAVVTEEKIIYMKKDTQ